MVGGVLALVGFALIGERFTERYVLDLGSQSMPHVRYVYFLVLWTFFSATAATLLAIGLFRAASSTAMAGLRHVIVRPRNDWAWLAGGAFAGFAIPCAIRCFVLHGARLWDDESAYRFMAEALAMGKVYANSPPMKLFFDNTFLVNDGRMYSQWFIGWPALMVPGVWLGVPGYMGAVYSGLTMPAIYLVLRRVAGSGWARLGLLITLSSPMLMMAAATELSHTSCVFALAWMFWAILRSRDDNPPAWAHAAVAVAVCVAFFVRPNAALGIALPALAWWGLGALKRPSRQRLVALLAFGVPAAAFAGLFLLVNYWQTGSALTTPYTRLIEYTQENQFRFTHWKNVEEFEWFGFHFGTVKEALTFHGVGLFRLNFALLGWPLSFIFLAFAGRRDYGWLFWSCCGGFMAVNFYMADPGTDTVGPVHYFELALPILLLTVLGCKRLADILGAAADDPTRAVDAPGRLRLVPPAVAVALVVVSLGGYWGVRLNAVERIAENVKAPDRALAAAGIRNAVIFAPRPFVSQVPIRPTTHFVYWRPNNDPRLRNDILWVNHISVEQDKELMSTMFPQRDGYVMYWHQGVEVRFLRLDELAAGQFPDGLVGGASP